MCPGPSLLTSRPLTNRSLVLLSGEKTALPRAEAEALFSAYDPDSKFESPNPRVLIAKSSADPFLIGSRIAFARRVGVLVDGPSEAASMVRGRKVRFRAFDLGSHRGLPDPGEYIASEDAAIDLSRPDSEVTLVRGERDYLAVTSPMTMSQDWSKRRPRRRPFFHPAAIFPKLSRALVNLTGCKRGDVFLDPFAGTGSLPLEAYMIGAAVVASDIQERMARGAAANMKHFDQSWLGVIRGDSRSPPVRSVDAVATDIPYGRASSTRGLDPRELVATLLPALSEILPQGARAVLMHQKEVVVSGGGFSVVGEHDLHVHKRLTRTITLLRRR
jgi:putative methyltransferase (TIGR01177 family)